MMYIRVHGLSAMLVAMAASFLALANGDVIQWNFDSPQEIVNMANMDHGAVANGLLSGAVTWDPNFYLGLPAAEIDARKFTWLTIRMYSSDKANLPASVYLIQFLLREAGVQVQSVEDGLEACAKVQASLSGNEPYDLVLMDVQMSKLDGLEATRRLRREGWGGPIVAITAHAMTATGRDAWMQDATTTSASPSTATGTSRSSPVT